MHERKKYAKRKCEKLQSSQIRMECCFRNSLSERESAQTKVFFNMSKALSNLEIVDPINRSYLHL